MKTLFINSNSMLRYGKGRDGKPVLAINDLNPEANIYWAVSRMDMMRIAGRSVIAALFH